jgi:hypothetical protein
MIGTLKFKVTNLEADSYNSYILRYTTYKIDQTVKIKFHRPKSCRDYIKIILNWWQELFYQK